MNATSHRHGHQIVWDADNDRWLWRDTGEPANWDRACASCGQPRTVEGHDACLGTLGGVVNACCGHGDPNDSYVMFSDRRTLYGSDAVAYFREQVAA